MQLKKQKCHTFWTHYKSTEILQAFYYFNIADYGIQLKKTQISYLKILLLSFQTKASFVFHLEVKAPESGERLERSTIQVA